MTSWPRHRLVLALTSVAFFLTALDFTIVNVAYRELEEDFGPGSASVLPWSLSGYAIAFAAGLLTAGRMADSYGRKRWFLAGTTVFTVSSALCGLAPTAEILVAARVAQAIGGAMLIPSATALLLPEYPVERRSAVMGITAMMGGIAAASGPAVGGFLVSHLGWRWVFFVNLPFCAISVVMGRRLLRESKDPTATRRPDFVGAALAISAVGLVTLAIIEGERWGWTSAAEWGCLIAAALLAVVFVVRCRRHPTPVLDLGLLRLRFVAAANGACLLWSVGFYAVFFTHVAWLQDVWGYSAQRSGFAIVPGPLTAAVTSPFAGKVAQRIGHLRVFLAGATCFVAASALLGLTLPDDPAYWTSFGPVLMMLGFGVGIVIASLTASANAYLPSHRFAMGSALYNTNRQVGAAVGVAAATAIGAVTPGADGLRHTYVFVAACVVAAIVAMAGFYRRPTEGQLAASVAATVSSA